MEIPAGWVREIVYRPCWEAQRPVRVEGRVAQFLAKDAGPVAGASFDRRMQEGNLALAANLATQQYLWNPEQLLWSVVALWRYRLTPMDNIAQVEWDWRVRSCRYRGQGLWLVLAGAEWSRRLTSQRPTDIPGGSNLAMAPPGLKGVEVVPRSPGHFTVHVRGTSTNYLVDLMTGVLVRKFPELPGYDHWLPADLNGDGKLDFIGVPSVGGANHIRVVDGRTGEPFAGPLGAIGLSRDEVASGIQASCADLDGDGLPDILTATGPGVPAAITGYSGRDGHQLGRFDPYRLNHVKVGVRVAAGDLGHDGRPLLVVVPRHGGGPQVQVFAGLSGVSLDNAFMAYADSDRHGLQVAVADLNGDGHDDVVVGLDGDLSGRPLHVYSGKNYPKLLMDLAPCAPAVGGASHFALCKNPRSGAWHLLAGPADEFGAQLRCFALSPFKELYQLAVGRREMQGVDLFGPGN